MRLKIVTPVICDLGRIHSLISRLWVFQVNITPRTAHPFSLQATSWLAPLMSISFGGLGLLSPWSPIYIWDTRPGFRSFVGALVVLAVVLILGLSSSSLLDPPLITATISLPHKSNRNLFQGLLDRTVLPPAPQPLGRHRRRHCDRTRSHQLSLPHSPPSPQQHHRSGHTPIPLCQPCLRLSSHPKACLP